ncbi:MAG TPA: peptidyl-prolyl cis-trans isomerase [Solirubrobacteraceae bacterium]
MSKRLGSVVAVCASVSLTLGLSACGGGGISGDAVVQIDGKPVSKATFNHWMGIVADSGAASAAISGQAVPKTVIPDPPAYKVCIAQLTATTPKPTKGQPKPTEAAFKSQCEQQYTALKQQALGFLITTDWIIGEAPGLHIKLTDKEVVKKFDELKKQQFSEEAKFKKFLASGGETISDLLLQVKRSLLTQKIEQKFKEEAAKKPTQKELTAYYEKHKSQYGQPERRDLEQILTKKQPEAEAAMKEIQAGKSFASVVKKRSIDSSSKKTSGLLSGVIKGQQDKPYDTAIFAAKQGVLSGPVKTPFGFYVFKVKTITAATQQKLAQVKSSISQAITAEKQQTLFAGFVKKFQKTWESRTECRAGYVIMNCKGYKAPKVATPVPTVAPAPSKTNTVPPVKVKK